LRLGRESPVPPEELRVSGWREQGADFIGFLGMTQAPHFRFRAANLLWVLMCAINLAQDLQIGVSATFGKAALDENL
jgi:hypothetical protein